MKYLLAKSQAIKAKKKIVSPFIKWEDSEDMSIATVISDFIPVFETTMRLELGFFFKEHINENGENIKVIDANIKRMDD